MSSDPTEQSSQRELPLSKRTRRCDTCGSQIDADATYEDGPLHLCPFCFATDLGVTIQTGGDAASTATSIAQAMNLLLRLVHDKPITKYKP